MVKKIVASIILGLGILVAANPSHANVGSKTVNQIRTERPAVTNTRTSTKEEKPNKEQYKVINPEKHLFSSENKVALINGIAPAKTAITIDLYGTTDLTRKNFNLDKLPEEKDYIKILTEEIESGNLGFYQKQLDLVMGMNKIVIDYGVKGIEPDVIIIYIYEKAPSLVEIISVIKQ